MKTLIYIFFIVSSLSGFCQEINLEFKNCQDAKDKAIALSNDDGYVFIEYREDSMESGIRTEAEQYFELYIFSKYDIIVSSRYHGAYPFDNCFEKETNNLLKNKFSINLETLRENILATYNSLTIKEKASIIDENKIYYSWIDSYVKYNGNDEELRDALKQMLRENKVLKSNSLFTITLGINGLVKDCLYSTDVNYTYGKSVEIDKFKFISFLNSNYQFIPAYLYGEKVSSIYEIYIRD